MKKFTHPSLSHTIIRFKDGSSYSKYWRYLRSTLILEGDEKKWEVGAVQKAPKFVLNSATQFHFFPKEASVVTANNFWNKN